MCVSNVTSHCENGVLQYLLTRLLQLGRVNSEIVSKMTD
jgi:hypothetical protein